MDDPSVPKCPIEQSSTVISQARSIVAEPNLDLKVSIDSLTKAVEELIEIFRTASTDIHSENSDLGKKFDALIKQNQEMAKALVTLLDVQREHLQKSFPPETSSFRKKIAPMPPVNPMPRIQPTISQGPVPVSQRPQFDYVEPHAAPQLAFNMMPPPMRQESRPVDLEAPREVKFDDDPLQTLSFDLPDFPDDKPRKEKKLF